MTNHVVSKQDLETKLKEIEDYVTKHGAPSHGVFGPKSMTWKLGQESIVFLGSGYALLMQEANQFVSVGVQQHGKVKTDPMGRWKRTFESINILMYGNLQEAFKTSRMIHNIHSKVYGTLGATNNTQYHANNENALFWVAATIFYTKVWMYELGVHKLLHEEKEEYYQECKRFCYMFGISDQTIPPNWNIFIVYYNNMIQQSGAGNHKNMLYVNEHAKELLTYFTKSYNKILHPLNIPSKLFVLLTSYMLPLNIRKQYGLKLSAPKEIFAEAMLLTIGKTYSNLPVQSRMNPYYRKAIKKLGL